MKRHGGYRCNPNAVNRAAVFFLTVSSIALCAFPAEARRHRQIIYSSSPSSHAQSADNDVVGRYHGFAAIVVDANTGRTIFSKNENELRHPASVTKVMTLYLLFEQLENGRLKLDTPLMISSHAAAQAPSKLGLMPGQTISVENAIKALVTKSANDIACAIAENVSGSEHGFAQLMTSKAHQLGMKHTHYENASGLPNADQVTTAYDLALLGRAIQDRFPKYYRYFSTHVFAYNGALHRNHNHLLERVEGMDGIKTGYTRASGFNLLTSVKRAHHHIVAVVLGGVSASSRDRIMADLIEEHIQSSATTRTVAALSETNSSNSSDTNSDNEIAQPLRPLRVANPIIARTMDHETSNNLGRKLVDRNDIDAEPTGATGNEGKALSKEIRDSSTENQAIRPAFVSGVKKSPVATETTKKDTRNAHSSKVGSTTTIDGSTSTRVTKAATVVGASTTPSAIRTAAMASANKPDVNRPTHAGWMIQVAAAETPEKASELLTRAKSHLQGLPPQVKPFTEKVQKGNETLYRARFAGLEQQTAESACRALKKSGVACFATKN